jgi:hypothetical protein
MPKTTDTRKHKVAELLRLLRNGPSYNENFDDTPFTAAQAAREFKLWSESWVLPVVHELVPELHVKKKRIKNANNQS